MPHINLRKELNQTGPERVLASQGTREAGRIVSDDEQDEGGADRRAALGRQGVIESVVGRGTARGIPEVHQIALRMNDGSLLEARMPTPDGVEVSGQIVPYDVEYFDFGECPICREPNPTSREHIPPHSIGGNIMTITCEACNNEFGSRYEPHLQAWYEGSLGRVLISGGEVPGRRRAGEYLYRVTPTGEFVLFQTGRSDPAVRQMLESGQVEITYPVFNDKAFHLAALKTGYLAACLIMKEVPQTPLGEAIRAELMAARDRDRQKDYELGPIASVTRVSRTAENPVPGEIVLVQLAHADGTQSFAISFNRVFAVDWPLEPIMLLPPGYQIVTEAEG